RDFSARTPTNECYDDIADQAFARAWLALSPGRFDNFPNLGALLAYLRACVTTVMIDYARAQAAKARIIGKIEVGGSASPEQLVLEKLERRELWRLVTRLTVTEQECTVLVESYMLDLPPRAIWARHS